MESAETHDVAADAFADVGLVHGPSLDRVANTGRHGRHRHRHLAAVEAGVTVASVGQLDTGQGAVKVDQFIHPGADRDVIYRTIAYAGWRGSAPARRNPGAGSATITSTTAVFLV